VPGIDRGIVLRYNKRRCFRSPISAAIKNFPLTILTTMKVLAINGSPKNNGNTAQALAILLEEVQNAGIETEIHTIGNKAVRGCIACGQCIEKQNGRCNAFDDAVNELVPKMIAADGLVLGSPTYFAGMNGTLKSFLDRAFYVARGKMRLKFGTAVVAVRRSGGIETFDQLNKYFQISEMTTAGSCYWNVIHGMTPGEIHQDLEGVRIVKTVGRNLVWLLKLAEHGQGVITPPEPLSPARTNFVR